MSLTEFLFDRRFWDLDTKQFIVAAIGGEGATLIKTENEIFGLLQITIAILSVVFLIVKLRRYLKNPDKI